MLLIPARSGHAPPFYQETALNLPAKLRAPGQGITIQLAHWQGPGPNVLAVHGLTAKCRSFDTIAQETAPPVNLSAVDLRGRGLSDHPETGYSLEQHNADLAAVIKHLGLKRLVVMGHSLGAYIALTLAARHPELVAGLILLDGGAALTPERWARVGAGVASPVARLGQRFDSCASLVELPELDHFGMVFQPNRQRTQAIKAFLGL